MNQHPIIFHYLFSASKQIHGQQCFRSDKRSLAQAISAIMFAPSSEKAAEQATTVATISTPHSMANF
jgi:hypothetical protein